MNSVQKPVWKAVWNSDERPARVVEPAAAIIRSRTGIISIWNGTRLPATNSDEQQQVAAEGRCFASAKPAIDDSSTVPITAGMRDQETVQR